MTAPIYPWKRFWFRREAAMPLTDRGYLADPEAEYGHLLNPDAVPTESLTGLRCLALLGEPGIGKTTALRSQWEAVKRSASNIGSQVLEFDLNEFHSEFMLIRTVFEDPALMA